MIKIIVNKDKFAAYGHSSEVLCSAVSMTVQTAYVGLEKYCIAKTYKRKNGRFLAKLHTNIAELAANIILTTMVAGLQNIAEQYPNEILVVDHRKA